MGCGSIARKFRNSMDAVDNGVVSTCASRTPGKADAFASEFNIPESFDRYEDMLCRPDVEAVYVATTHNYHHECVMMCLDHGKAVLCEKPLAVNAGQTLEMVNSAREKKLFLMEGMWTRFLPAIRQMKAWIYSGEIGVIKMIRADFCFHAGFNPESRLFNPGLAGGALLDAGVYPVSLASHVMGEQPVNIKALADIGETGVDEQSAYLFSYSDGRIALLSAAVKSASENRAEISGTKGRIVIPSRFLGAQDVELHLDDGKSICKHLPNGGPLSFSYEIQAANDAVQAGELELDEMPLDESLAIAETMDRIRTEFHSA